REVALEKILNGKPQTVLVLAFDDQFRLVAVRDAHGAKLVDVTWGIGGPTAAHVRGEEISVGYTPEAMSDAVAWAHGSVQPGVVVELPVRAEAYWTKRVAAETAGSATWRHAQRQLMAS